MRIILITQNDPFYLARNLEYLLSARPRYADVVGCVVSDVSPFGKKESFLRKTLKTHRIFGTRFFLRQALRYVVAKLNPKASIFRMLNRNGIECIELTGSINSEASLARLRTYNPDLLISIAGNEIFRRPLIDLAPMGCLNLHSSLLPKYRGLMPSFWVLKNRERVTGVSVFFVDDGIDSGPILVQKSIEIGNMSQDELIRQTKYLGMEAIIEAIKKIHAGDNETMENRDEDKSYYSFPTRADVMAFRAAGGRFY